MSDLQRELARAKRFSQIVFDAWRAGQAQERFMREVLGPIPRVCSLDPERLAELERGASHAIEWGQAHIMLAVRADELYELCQAVRGGSVHE